ncbi:Hypothetical predicted protein [Pelobates cultripes]|uniref:Uncharacterized protein n=1 Tax=Pelobates cultripes TaxID=61616 RepID=A0AAD1TLX1_PELCU|nr:Hypothetical predicted protein [Pelobates cultripes]
MPSLINSPPAQLTFAPASDEGENEDQEMEVTPKVMIKPFTDTWTAVSALLATTQNHMTKHSLAPPAAKKFIIAQPEMLTVKQELIPLKSDMETGRCESQGSVMSSNEDSLGPSTGQAEWTVNSNGDNKAASVGSGDTIQLKVEDEVESQKSDGNSQEAAEASWNENQDEWERQSASPQPSENAQEDSAHSSSSQEEEPNSAGELARNGECASPTDEHKGPWRTNMHRLLELEEQWDSMYHRELGMWEEERAQQREQRAQDRELQQQLLSVLTDIRDELRYIREERVAARQNQASNGSPLVVSPPPPSRPVTPAESLEPSSEPHSETPAQKTLVLAPLGSSTPGTLKRTRGRPRLLKPTSLPDNES